MTRMWFGEEGASDHCQMIVERVMGLREDGTEDWDLFVDNLYVSQDLGKPIQEVNQNSKLASKNFIKKGRNELARVEHT